MMDQEFLVPLRLWIHSIPVFVGVIKHHNLIAVAVNNATLHAHDKGHFYTRMRYRGGNITAARWVLGIVVHELLPRNTYFEQIHGDIDKVFGPINAVRHLFHVIHKREIRRSGPILTAALWRV